ncbi:hypothetical protein AOQ84DRAFT_224014 [Glonium stellatum]|uniref:Heterokaryon incompatibility domain-containing protein n=1 Tax=Glonium stellatum TaxID=574774 RepID=A0A8E2EWN1_9PEZI|nr:hypothetical protein AOQ84DRAFT_224014 [Glonium stellatum]
MEHLPLKGGRAPILVPYIPADLFDGGDFLGYPQRSGWDFSLWRAFDTFGASLDLESWLIFNGRTVDELPAFLQTWLFFGLIASVIEHAVPLEDFVRRDLDGQYYITTADLTRHLEDWELRVHDSTSPVLENTGMLVMIAENIVHAQAINENLSRVIVYGACPPPYLEQLEGVHFCVALLIRALSVASEQALGRHPDVFRMGQTRIPLLERRMRDAGWCPHIVSRLSTEFPNDMQAYIFCLGTIRVKQNHAQCTYHYCVANQVGEVYQVQHLQDDCNCKLISPPMEEVIGVLQRGNVPLLRISNGNTASETPTFQVQESNKATPYIALSHVSIDGLGNSPANSIPMCQLAEIKRGMQNIFDNEQQQLMPFWLDTLCLPADPKHRALRNFSIGRMHQIYKSSHGVLILDHDLRLLTSHASYAEVITRICISGWNTRLWTYEESALSSRLYILGKDNTFHIENLHQRLLEGEFQDPISHSLNMFAAASFRVFVARKTSDNIAADSDRDVQDMLCAISKRATSCPGDETICIASFLDLDVSSLLEASPAYRMKVLLSLLPVIPANILFSAGPRLTQWGYRWAPSSLLQPHGMAGQPIPERVPTSASMNAERMEMIVRPLSYLHPGGKGLMAYLPAVAVTRIDFSKDRFLIDLSDGEVLRVGFFLQNKDRVEGKQKILGLGNRSFVILLAMFFHDECRGFNLEQKGILAEVMGKARDPAVKSKRLSFKQVPVIEYKEPVFVERTSRTGDFGGVAGNKCWLKGEYVEPKWWLID